MMITESTGMQMEANFTRLGLAGSGIDANKPAPIGSVTPNRSLLEASNDALLIYNSDYKIVDANSKAIELLGYTHAELFKLHLPMICPGLQDPSFQKAFETLVEVENSCLITDFNRADGGILKVDLCAETFERSQGLVKLVIQKTPEQRRLISENQTRDGLLEALVRVTPDTLMRLDTSGSICRTNRGLDGCGWTPDDLWGQSLTRFVLPEDRHKLDEFIQRCAFGGALGKPTVIRIQVKNVAEDRPASAFQIEPAYRSFSLVAEGIFSDPAGHSAPLGHWVILRDLTEEINAKAARERLEAQLRQTQKLEAIGALAGGIAHDFNNILSAIFGNTQLAQMALPETHKAHAYLQLVREAGYRAKCLVGQILAVNRASEPEKTAVDLGGIVKEAERLLRASLPSTIDIRQTIATSGRKILADPTQIHQVLMNLGTNALHALEGNNGHVDISLTDVELVQGDPACETLRPGQYLRLAVADDGCGMDADTLKHIFKPYFTTKKPDKGTGLGLSIVLGIVQAHGGSIGVQSEPGCGTSFTIHLPCINDPACEPAPPGKSLHTGSEQILFVDDEKMLGEVVEQMLTQLGYRVHIETCPLRALAVFEKAPQKYQLVMTDMTMPGMTGVGLAEAVMKIQPQTPVIICSGFSDITLPTETSTSGIWGFIEKPFTIDHLSLKLRQVLDSRPIA